jgi:methyl-accepting chemotaxis protein
MMSLSKFRLGTRLAVGFAALLTLMITMTFVGIIYVGKLHDHLTEIVGDRFVKVELVSLMERTVQDQATLLHNITVTDDNASRQQEMKRLEEQQVRYRDAADKLEKQVSSDAGKALLSKVKEGAQSALPLKNTVVELAMANKKREATQVLTNQYRPAQSRWSAALDNMVKFQQERVGKSGDEADRAYSASRLLLFGLGGAGLVLGALIAFFLTRSISRPINYIVEGLTESSEQVASASGQVASASQSLAEGASQQAAALEETSSAMEEMASMTKQNADNAQSTNQAAVGGSDLMTKARESMKALIRSIEEIAKASEETGKIIKTIDEIAFQTNLLALNAAVEAARAGEAGAGFAVVADEVRNLAMRAAEAAKNTSHLIEGTIKKVKEGSELVHRTDESYRDVALALRQVVGLVGEIAAASQEQAQGIEQINKAVAEMDKVVQENAANAEESASASEEMNAQAEQMKEFVGHLVSLMGGNTGAGTSPVKQGQISGYEGNVSTANRQPGIGIRKTFVPTMKKGRDKQMWAGGYRKAKEVRPDQVIPLEEEDFREF